MVSAPVLCWEILGGGEGLGMLQNIDLFPILSVASESHGSGVRPASQFVKGTGCFPDVCSVDLNGPATGSSVY